MKTAVHRMRAGDLTQKLEINSRDETGELALAFCAAGSPQDQARITNVLKEHARERFAAAYLNERGLDHWAVRLNTLNTERKDHEQLIPEYDGNSDGSEASAAAT